MTDPMTTRRRYGRRQGHKLRLGQADLVEQLLPEISVPETGPLDATRLFGDVKGFGQRRNGNPVGRVARADRTKLSAFRAP